jgi:hypothetical protein
MDMGFMDGAKVIGEAAAVAGDRAEAALTRPGMAPTLPRQPP